MDNKKLLLMKNYLSNLKVEVQYTGFTKVWPEWRDMDYIPGYNKFYFICHGEGWLRIDGTEYYPKPGQLFLMPQGVRQSYSSINENTFTKYWCHFTAKIGDINLFDIVRLPHFIDVEDKTMLKGLFRQLTEYYESNELTSALRAKAIMLEIISYYLENAVIGEIRLTSSDLTDKLNPVLEYIDNHLNGNISIEKLAQIIHLHPNYFIRFFRKHLGASPINYINHKRMDKAKLLLETGDDTLAVIAEKTGIGDIYYLSRMFKEYTGFSPSEYRKLVLK